MDHPASDVSPAICLMLHLNERCTLLFRENASGSEFECLKIEQRLLTQAGIKKSSDLKQTVDRFFDSFLAEAFAERFDHSHVELCVLGHLHRTRAIDRPPAGHYERWLISRGRNEEALKLWATGLPPDVGAAQTWNSALPAAWHNSTWIADRAIHYLEQRLAKRKLAA